MKKINNFSIFVFLAGLSVSSQVFAYALPTFSIPEIGQEIASYVSEASKTKSEVESTNDLIKKGVLAGVPGYLKAIQSGDWNGLAKGMANEGYNIYKQDAERKKQAKEKAQKEAQENAQAKLEAQEEAKKTTEGADDENRKTAAENRKEKVKKKLNWVKKQGGIVGNWLNKKDGKNKEGVNKIADGLFEGNPQISSAIRDATNKLSAQANTNEEDEKGAEDAQNKPNES